MLRLFEKHNLLLCNEMTEKSILIAMLKMLKFMSWKHITI